MARRRLAGGLVRGSKSRAKLASSEIEIAQDQEHFLVIMPNACRASASTSMMLARDAEAAFGGLVTIGNAGDGDHFLTIPRGLCKVRRGGVWRHRACKGLWFQNRDRHSYRDIRGRPSVAVGRSHARSRDRD